jgi:hypothetical protein
MTMEQRTTRAALPHALKMVQARPRWEGATSAIFHLAERLAQRQESIRSARTELVLSYLGLNGAMRRIAVIGQIAGLDLSGLTFENCVFKDLEFHNCRFDGKTQFVKSRFDGNLAFENCEGAGLAKLIDCVTSHTAEDEWDRQAGRTARTTVSRNVAKEAVRYALRKFIGPYGFSTIKDVDRNSGPLAKSPCRDHVWDELIRVGILERHFISGVKAGGLNVGDNPEVRHEVRNFLDNAVLGPRLANVVEVLLRRR